MAELFAFYNANSQELNYFNTTNFACLEKRVLPTDIGALGGVVKIGQEICFIPSLDDAAVILQKQFAQYDAKITFGISIYNIQPDPTASGKAFKLGKEVKALLKDSGASVRFVDNRGVAALSSASVWHNKLVGDGTEFLLIEQETGYILAKTIAVQPFEEFSERDFGRPGRDDKSGMLPPKLALMMLNLAPGEKSKLLLDPFCGSGTILSEALLQGYTNMIGGDLSDKAVADTQKNLEWLRKSKTDTEDVKIQLFQADAADLGKKVSKHAVKKIVTEPFLGPPLKGGESAGVIEKIITELKPLYTAALNQFLEVLEPGGVVVMVIPRWFSNGSWRTLSDLLPFKNKKSGLKPDPLLPPEHSKTPYIIYHRPGQHVGREIWRFTKV